MTHTIQIGDFVWVRMSGLTIRFEITTEQTTTLDGVGHHGYNPLCLAQFIPLNKIIQYGYEFIPNHNHPQCNPVPDRVQTHSANI